MSDTQTHTLGHLTAEELTTITTARQRGQQNMLRLGEIVFQTSRLRQQQKALELKISALREQEVQSCDEERRLCEELETIEQDGRAVIDQVTKRLGLEPGVQWVAMQDGSIRWMESK